MTDLSQLFVLHKPSSPYQSYSQPLVSQQPPPIKNLFGTKPLTVQSQPKPSLSVNSVFTTPLHRSEKELSKLTVNSYAMSEEIEYFKKLHLKEFFYKAGLLLVSLFGIWLFGLVNRKACFEMMLFGMAMLTLETKIVENRSLKLFINTLPILTYLALFYDILTINNYAGNYFVTLANVPALLVSIVAVVNFVFFRKMAFLPEQNFKSVTLSETKREIFQSFYKKYLLRVKNNAKLYKESLTLNGSMLLVFVSYCIFSLKPTLFQETLVTLPYGIVIYALVDLFVYWVEFVSRELHLIRLKQKFYQMDVCMALLRVRMNQNGQEENEKIHHRCLYELAREMRRNNDYLETPVKVNYAINSYRDIVDIYATEDLSKLLQVLNESTGLISKNNKTIESTKSLKQDLFIYLKKIIARISNSYLILRILSEIEKRKILFLILNKLAFQGQLRTKIVDVVGDIINSTQKTAIGRQFFDISGKKLDDWVGEMEKLIKFLSSSSGRSPVTISERDENGWLHYRRANPNDVMEN